MVAEESTDPEILRLRINLLERKLRLLELALGGDICEEDLIEGPSLPELQTGLI